MKGKILEALENCIEKKLEDCEDEEEFGIRIDEWVEYCTSSAADGDLRHAVELILALMNSAVIVIGSESKEEETWQGKIPTA